MTTMLSTKQFPTISYCAMVYIKLYNHLESYIVDPQKKLKGIDPKTGKQYPTWLQDAANKAFQKLDKYYPSSDGLVYIVGTSKLLFFYNPLSKIFTK